MQNMPIDHRYYERRIADLERRLAALETAPRAGNTSISGGKLTVGAPDSPNRIEIDATESHIRFNSAEGPADIIALGGGAGTELIASEAAGGTFPSYGAEGTVSNGSYAQALDVSRVDGDTTTIQAEVYVSMSDYGGGNSAGSVSLRAHSNGASDSAMVAISSEGGLNLSTNGRTTDPPAPAADAAVLYVKNSRLWVRDSAGARQL